VNDTAIDTVVAGWRQWAEHQPRIIGTLSGGLSNSSVLLQVADKRCVLRLNGKALGVDRLQEAAARGCAAQRGLAPALLFQDPNQNFQISEYLPGGIWTEADLGDPSQLSKLAALLAAIHSLPAIESQLDIASKIALYKSMQRYHSVVLAKLEHSIDDVVNNICATAQPYCLCHGDLLAANIVENEGRLWALDWEYAAMSSPYFDLAVVLEGQYIDPVLQRDFIEQYQSLRPQALIDVDSLHQWRILYGYLDALWYALQADDEIIAEQVELKVARLAAMLKY